MGGLEMPKPADVSLALLVDAVVHPQLVVAPKVSSNLGALDPKLVPFVELSVAVGCFCVSFVVENPPDFSTDESR